jgi:hypothetical protein
MREITRTRSQTDKNSPVPRSIETVDRIHGANPVRIALPLPSDLIFATDKCVLKPSDSV